MTKGTLRRSRPRQTGLERAKSRSTHPLPMALPAYDEEPKSLYLRDPDWYKRTGSPVGPTVFCRFTAM